MPKFLKPGKVVLVVAGRYAGKKAIVVKVFEEGSKEHKFPHALIAGIDKAPLPVTKAMSKKKIQKRSRIKPFIKYVNLQHLMPTRYSVNDIDLKTTVNPTQMKQANTRIEARKEVKKVLEQRYLERGKNTTGVQFLYAKLRF